MAWPWPGSKRRAAKAMAEPSDAPAATAGAMSGPGPGSSGPAWAQLPPIGRAVTSVLAQPIVTTPAVFLEQLPSRWQQSPVLGPLSHAVTNIGPAAEDGAAGRVAAASGHRIAGPSPVSLRAADQPRFPMSLVRPAVVVAQPDAVTGSDDEVRNGPSAPRAVIGPVLRSTARTTGDSANSPSGPAESTSVLRRLLATGSSQPEVEPVVVGPPTSTGGIGASQPQQASDDGPRTDDAGTPSGPGLGVRRRPRRGPAPVISTPPRADDGGHVEASPSWAADGDSAETPPNPPTSDPLSRSAPAGEADLPTLGRGVASRQSFATPTEMIGAEEFVDRPPASDEGQATRSRPYPGSAAAPRTDLPPRRQLVPVTAAPHAELHQPAVGLASSEESAPLLSARAPLTAARPTPSRGGSVSTPIATTRDSRSISFRAIDRVRGGTVDDAADVANFVQGISRGSTAIRPPATPRTVGALPSPASVASAATPTSPELTALGVPDWFTPGSIGAPTEATGSAMIPPSSAERFERPAQAGTPRPDPSLQIAGAPSQDAQVADAPTERATPVPARAVVATVGRTGHGAEPAVDVGVARPFTSVRVRPRAGQSRRRTDGVDVADAPTYLRPPDVTPQGVDVLIAPPHVASAPAHGSSLAAGTDLAHLGEAGAQEPGAPYAPVRDAGPLRRPGVGEGVFDVPEQPVLLDAMPPMSGPSVHDGGAGQPGLSAGGPAHADTAQGGQDAHTAHDVQHATDPASLDRLADQLYGRLRGQMINELLVGRERSQHLTDF